MLAIIAIARGVYICLEQPASSTMHYLPDFQALATAVDRYLGPGMWKEQFLFGTRLWFETIGSLSLESILCRKDL